MAARDLWGFGMPKRDFYKEDFTFSNNGRDYKISFNNYNIALIKDMTGKGKYIMCDDLLSLTKLDKDYSDVLVLNYQSPDIAVLLSNDAMYDKYTVIVIDNADYLVTPTVSQIIDTHMDKFWVLCGRSVPNCVPNKDCICKLIRQGNLYYTEYEDFKRDKVKEEDYGYSDIDDMEDFEGYEDYPYTSLFPLNEEPNSPDVIRVVTGNKYRGELSILSNDAYALVTLADSLFLKGQSAFLKEVWDTEILNESMRMVKTRDGIETVERLPVSVKTLLNIRYLQEKNPDKDYIVNGDEVCEELQETLLELVRGSRITLYFTHPLEGCLVQGPFKVNGKTKINSDGIAEELSNHDFMFSHRGRNYRITFNNSNIVMISSNSGKGMSQLAEDLRERFLCCNARVLVLSYHQYGRDFFDLSNFTDCYDLVVIDTADILITPKVSKIISSHPEVHWILIGRTLHPCVPSVNCVCKLKNDGNNYYTEYLDAE